MSDTIIFSIEHRHISQDAWRDACQCPMAAALKERLPGKRITVGSALASIDGVLYLLGSAGAAFVRNFDEQKSVEPCTITLKPC